MLARHKRGVRYYLFGREVGGTHTSEGEAVSARPASLPLRGAQCGRTLDRHPRAAGTEALDPAWTRLARGTPSPRRPSAPTPVHELYALRCSCLHTYRLSATTRAYFTGVLIRFQNIYWIASSQAKVSFSFLYFP